MLRKNLFLLSTFLVFLLISHLLSLKAKAYPQDTMLLFELVSNTASQLNELENLVTKTEKYTQRMQKYNEMAIDQVDRARRIANFAEEQVYIVEADPKSLSELNQLVRDLKLSADNLDSLIYEYKMSAVESKKGQDKAIDNEKEQAKRTKQLKNEAFDGHSTAIGFQYQTKVNTANVAVEASKTNQNLLSLKKSTDQTNTMMAQENIRKVEEEKELRQYYGLENDNNKKNGLKSLNGNSLKKK